MVQAYDLHITSPGLSLVEISFARGINCSMLKSPLKFYGFIVFLGKVEIIANYSVLAKSKFCFDCDSIF